MLEIKNVKLLLHILLVEPFCEGSMYSWLAFIFDFSNSFSPGGLVQLPFTAVTTQDVSPDPQELTLDTSSSGEMAIQTLDISTNLPSTLAEGLSAAGTLDSILEPIGVSSTTPSSENVVESKIDIIS